MEIPADSAIAISSRSNQMLDKLDRQQMKTLVLNQTGRQEDNEKKGVSAYFCSKFNQVVNVDVCRSTRGSRKGPRHPPAVR
jgi:hypothetical protein